MLFCQGAYRNITESEGISLKKYGSFIVFMILCALGLVLIDMFTLSLIGRESALRYSSRISFVSIVIFVALSALYFIYMKISTKKLDELMRISKKVSTGDLNNSRCNLKGKDEYAFIGQCMDYVLDVVYETKQQNQILMNMTNNIIFWYHIDRDKFTVSDNFNKVFSYRSNSYRFSDSFFENIRVYKDDQEKFNHFKDVMLEKGKASAEVRLYNIYNEYAWYHIISDAIKNQNGKLVQITGALVDIDKIKHREKALEKLASVDTLTQILNRTSFEVSALSAWELAVAKKANCYIMFIDLDDFKRFNDEYSHAVGDEVLIFVASTLNKIVADHGFAGRYGGDEFVLFLRADDDDVSPKKVCESIIKTLNLGFDSQVAKLRVGINCSIGVCACEGQVKDADEVIKRADSAMYSVKKNGKSNYAFYN